MDMSNGSRSATPVNTSKKNAEAEHDSSFSTITIPATPHCPSYSSVYLSGLAKTPASKPGPFGGNSVHSRFAHLPCSLIANSSVPPPTVLALKQHIQALCQLLSNLEPAPPTDEPFQSVQRGLPAPTFDFLTGLQIPYRSDDPAENKPVASLANQHPSAAEFYAATSRSRRLTSDPAQTCPFDLDPASRTIAHARAHANKLLTYLDHRYASTGGILSMTPSSAAAHTLLGQWLLYTSRLVVRVAALEREVVNLREVLGNEALVAGVRAHASQNQNGESSAREMLFPQDRYVLAGLSDTLWLRITEALSISAEEAIDREIDTGAGMVRGSGPFQTSTGTDPDPATNQEEQVRYGDVVSWVETTARLYRVRGHETVFVIPAWDMHPGVEAVRAVERGPLVMSLPKVRNSGAGTADEWRTVGVSAHEREAEAETTRLMEEIASLKRSLEEVRDEHEDEKRLCRNTEERAELAEARINGEQEENESARTTYPNPASSSASSAASTSHNERAQDDSYPTSKHISWAVQTGIAF